MDSLDSFSYTEGKSARASEFRRAHDYVWMLVMTVDFYNVMLVCLSISPSSEVCQTLLPDAHNRRFSALS